ncbi:MAG TPA: hypothetical protein VD962_06625 [Rubricoccaceae bacterium]|nr:hypothetical protein [Rubricoccaceae bacterium]
MASDPAPPPAPGNLRWWTALIVGLSVFMLAALAAPRLTDDEGASWALAAAVGAAAALLTVGVMLARRGRAGTEERPIQH